MDQGQKASLGCGTLILIALIVMIIGNMGGQDAATKIGNLQTDVQRLEKTVAEQSVKIDAMERTLSKLLLAGAAGEWGDAASQPASRPFASSSKTTRVACDPYLGVWIWPRELGDPEIFTPATPDNHTTNPHATIVTWKQARGLVKIAIDAESPEATTPDIIRIDFSGRGDFQNCPMVKLPPLNTPISRRDFGPAVVQVTKDGETLPVWVAGWYAPNWKGDGRRWFKFQYCTAVESECNFAGKIHKVRVLDTKGNLHLGDVPPSGDRFVSEEDSPWYLGDSVVVDLGDGTFDREKGGPFAKGYLGQPFNVDGKLYNIIFSVGEPLEPRQLLVVPFAGPTGKLVSPQDKWAILMVSGHCVMNCSATSGVSQEAPAGRYKVISVSCQSPREVIIRPGETTNLQEEYNKQMAAIRRTSGQRLATAPAVERQELVHVKAGEIAPLFETQTLDGQPLRLTDFRGKYVLLDFWATWCGPCRRETPYLKAVYEAYGSDPRFAMIGLSLDQNVSAPREYVKQNGLNWTHGFLGNWSKDTVTKLYGIRGIPCILLIAPEGKILATSLRGEAIKASVGRYLGEKPAETQPTGQ
jgi:thiol-disulfide isomerase/thioredoxin